MEQLHAVISGANRGLGLALVRQGLEKGWAITALSHRAECQELMELTGLGKMRIMVVELGSDKSVRAIAKDLPRGPKHIDLIINNAAVLGRTTERAGDGLDYNDMLRTLGINSLGPLRLVEACWPMLLRGSCPTVANISSEAGSIGACGRDGWYGYNMSKAALNMAGRILHNQLRPLGGRVIQVHPGWVRTWIEGHYNEAATLGAEESAAGVWGRIEAYRALAEVPGEPPFVDWSGKSWPW